ncbi:MAG: hypothetical protein Q9208_001584 [Pyrenodesmia sp. 3 TL-2023]
MDTDQRHGAQKRAMHGAHGIVLVQEPGNVRIIGLIDQTLLPSSLAKHLVHQSQDRVFSKHIRRLTISSVELQASKEDKARPLHPSIYLNGRQALFHVHDLLSRAAKAKTLQFRMTDIGKDREETIDQMPKTVDLSRPVLPPRSSDPAHIFPNSPPLISEPVASALPSQASVHTRNRIPGPAQDAPVLFTEPLIECNRCGKKHLEYALHWNCSKCYEGNYNICMSCYRLGRGCLQWYGFGYAALQRYQRDTKDLSKREDLSPPHTLVGHRYKHPEPETAQGPPSEGSQKQTSQDPKQRLQAGAFCAICFEFTDHCFWKCGSCNDGEWGYCNRCVNQGRCCTHPLLPVAHDSSLTAGATDTSTSSKTTSFIPATQHYSRSSPHFIGLSQPEQYVPLTLSTKCNICEYPIPPSNTRFHCPQCNNGDFNICTTSYLKLITSGHLGPENGDKGWRRCPAGHRMVVLGFEDSPAGQRRVLVKDLVGGHALKNDGNDAAASLNQEWSWQDGQQRHTRTVSKHLPDPQAPAGAASPPPAHFLQRYPPSGGLGMRVLALWSYWPSGDAQDELSFPKGAEVREVENINGDWFVGCYAGRMGLFPGNYVRVLDVVRS